MTEDSRLVTFGESMLRLSPPGHERLTHTDRLDVHVAGAESNVAVAANAVGLPSTWTSKLPESPLGRRVTNALREYGIDTAVAWSDDGRQGTYYVEAGTKPRGTNVVYDREGASVRTATVDDLPLDRIAAADAFYTSGITPALGETLRETTEAVLEAARGEDTLTVFDVNYRSKLWTGEEARAGIEPLLGDVDVLVCARRDAELVFDVDGTPAEKARALADEYGVETVVVTRGANGALAVHDGDVVERDAFETETVDAVGSGDAFVGGFLAKFVPTGDVGRALEYGTATAALKRTIPGDMAAVTREEVEALVAEGGDGGISR
ncbi:bifunctional 2-dehydro-3-deoxygluconokinase/2-dehydro-3-deoxygalactonokinase [Halocalculus aciditolerans]|uniref:2-keto-3-deoxygluconate kinase n=1 Tax=Halocalculus aciditolerans TaxID=1383812 RepID=A0A830F201_9EURY|nr:bifunctional 2-dehydro-3-deoxygluconokinase/2-dehydro-3-deoxygalactonokinase [Halocalculus aciditolerans]GGL47408.1 2-keto-3-deoxygluconate kinase [Halocalculus aciditolerans]